MPTKEREIVEVDVLFVGGGIASLASAFHLTRLAKEKGQELVVAILDKSTGFGQHCISGAIMDPQGIAELMPDYLAKGMPVEGTVEKDEVRMLTKNGSVKMPINPPFLKNTGFPIVSLTKVCGWLAKLVEAQDVNMFFGFAGSELLYDGDRLAGVRCADTGLDKEGKPKANFSYGPDIMAKVVVFGEGARGSLTKTLVKKFNLDEGRNPQGFTLGVKEVWEVPEAVHRKGVVCNTMGYPLAMDTFGGSFVYFAEPNKVYIGLVASLDSPDPALDVHEKLQVLKEHPLFEPILREGKLTAYGARVLPEGGWFALPRLYADGALIIGDAAGFIDAMRIKGIHLAIKSGMLAAETILEAAAQNDYSAATLKRYEEKIEQSWIKKQLWKARNFHAAFSGGLIEGCLQVPLQMFLNGWSLGDRIETTEDHTHISKQQDYYGEGKTKPAAPAGKLTQKKESEVFFSGTEHEEHQPSHLHISDLSICNGKCITEYGNPCQHFCPANVYEMHPDETGALKLRLNPSNCLHCKTCDIRDPYGIITWVCPEGGGGPHYKEL